MDKIANNKKKEAKSPPRGKGREPGSVNSTTPIKKEAMVIAMEKMNGNISKSCKLVGISRQTHRDWLESDADYAEKISEITEAVIDEVEAILQERIKENKDVVAAIFFLKTIGRGRGYGDRTEITGKDGKDLIPEKFTPSEIKVSVVSNTA